MRLQRRERGGAERVMRMTVADARDACDEVIGRASGSVRVRAEWHRWQCSGHWSMSPTHISAASALHLYSATFSGIGCCQLPHLSAPLHLSGLSSHSVLPYLSLRLSRLFILADALEDLRLRNMADHALSPVIAACVVSLTPLAIRLELSNDLTWRYHTQPGGCGRCGSERELSALSPQPARRTPHSTSIAVSYDPSLLHYSLLFLLEAALIEPMRGEVDVVTRC